MTLTTATSERIAVRFEGEGSGVEELTWAQRDVWDIMRRTGRTMNIGGPMALPPGMTIENITAIMQLAMNRHPSLRTRLRFADDDRPQQVLSASGEVFLDIVDTAEDDIEAVVEALRVRLQITPFDPVNEWPARFFVLRHHGVLTHLVAMYYHVAVDGFGIDALRRDLVALGTGADQPVVGLQALEQARQERTPSTRRHSDRSLRYWERLLREIPARRLRESDVPSEKPQPPIWELCSTSMAMRLAVESIAARKQVESGPIFLAAASVALARVTKVNPSVLQVLVSNRFRADCAESVTNFRQFGLCAIDVADRTFDGVVGQAWRSAMAAYVHGYYDTLAHRELVDRVNSDRGEDVDISFYLNDRRTSTRELAGGVVPTQDEMLAALSLTTLQWGIKEATYDGAFYLHIEDIAETVSFTLYADTHLFPPTAMWEFARQFESVLVEAAFNPRAPTGILASYHCV